VSTWFLALSSPTVLASALENLLNIDRLRHHHHHQTVPSTTSCIYLFQSDVTLILAAQKNKVPTDTKAFTSFVLCLSLVSTASPRYTILIGRWVVLVTKKIAVDDEQVRT
jgi:hypothetical protein